MKAPRSLAPLAGRTLGSPDGSFVVAEWSDEGGVTDSSRLIAPLHIHRHDDEAWYVLEGRLRFRLGADEVEACAGSAVLAPRGVPHTYWNPAAEPARYLLIMPPNVFRLVEEIHQTPDRDPARMHEIFVKYDSELLA